jgi:peptidyl-prolyl cis-trans isomerase A (cyclophilin A)/peptidyl-prolyl cis-trans isomerase B (cyclophilin B)
MQQILLSLILMVCLGVMNSAQAQGSDAVRVRIETSMGDFVVQLDASRAPLTVANFLEYVRSGHYEGTIFHRVINNFVAQGGGYDEKLTEKPTQANVVNESGNGLTNRRSTIGMARTGEPHSADAQFYISLADNPALDPQPGRWGYAVFGTVVEGMQVVDSIGGVATEAAGPFDSDVPLKPIVISKIVELK